MIFVIQFNEFFFPNLEILDIIFNFFLFSCFHLFYQRRLIAFKLIYFRFQACNFISCSSVLRSYLTKLILQIRDLTLILFDCTTRRGCLLSKLINIILKTLNLSFMPINLHVVIFSCLIFLNDEVLFQIIIIIYQVSILIS